MALIPSLMGKVKEVRDLGGPYWKTGVVIVESTEFSGFGPGFADLPGEVMVRFPAPTTGHANKAAEVKPGDSVSLYASPNEQDGCWDGESIHVNRR